GRPATGIETARGAICAGVARGRCPWYETTDRHHARASLVQLGQKERSAPAGRRGRGRREVRRYAHRGERREGRGEPEAGEGLDRGRRRRRGQGQHPACPSLGGARRDMVLRPAVALNLRWSSTAA